MIKLKDLLFERDLNDTKDTGGVLYYSGDGKVLLCLGARSGTWHVPKGHIQIGEEPLVGSVREFTEETQMSLNGIPELANIYKKDNGGKFYLYVLKGKTKFVRGKKSTKSGYKKAIVTLKKGQMIDLSTGI